jgi:hypothetical protein
MEWQQVDDLFGGFIVTKSKGWSLFDLYHIADRQGSAPA